MAESGPQKVRRWDLEKLVTGRTRESPASRQIQVTWGLHWHPLQWPEMCEQWHDLSRPEQDLHGVRIRKRMVREGRKEDPKERFLIWPLGKKLSALMLATSLPYQFDCGVSSFCRGPEIRWSLLPLWNMHPGFGTSWFGSGVSGQEFLVCTLLKRVCCNGIDGNLVISVMYSILR